MRILTNNVDKLPVLVTVLLKRARAVSGLPAGTPIEVVDNPQADDIRITLGTVKGYKGDAYKTLSPKQIVSNPQAILFLAQALQYGYLGPVDPGLGLGKDWVIWEGQDISFKKGSVIALDIESAGDIDNDTFAAGRILSIALWNGKFGVVIPEELAETPESAELIERLCRDCIVVCHNGTFDMPYLSKRLGINVYHHEDTLLMHFVLDNLAGEHGLKPLARRWLRAADWDSDAKSYLKHGAYFENIPREKLYEYNCIAEGSPVLTDRGLVPIEDVQLTDKVWDGVEWVQHEGVVYKGTQSVVVLDELVVTPEHLILTTEGDYVCARSIQAGIRRPAIGGNGALPQTISAINWEDEQTEQRVCGVHGAECPTGPLVGPGENGQPKLSTNEMGANTQTTKWDVSAGGDSKATPSTARVYDILNAGPRHRFTVSGIVVSNCYDAYWTYELYNYFKQMVDKSPDFYNHRMRVTRVLHDVQMNGVAVSINALDELEDEYNHQCDEHLVILKKLAGEDFNPQSPKQIAEYFASKGVSSPSFDAKHLKKLKRAGREPEFIDALLAYRYAAKVIGSFIANVRRKRGEDKRIHPYYLPHGAKTGRLSAKGPAIQTMGRDSGIKRALVAEPGYKIISCDYSQAELRTVAELADDKAMIAAFQPGAPDFFDDLMTKIWPDDYPTIEAYEAFKHEHPKTAKNKRALVKSVVYGLNYGRGIAAIAAELEKPFEEAKYVVDQYLGAYPGLRNWQQKVRHSVGRGEENYMRQTKFGMTYNPLFVPDADYASTQNEALAFVPQSTANDICLNAAIKINEQVGQYGAKLIGLVHDATYVECPEETIEECSKMMEREMSKAATLVFNRVPFVAEAEVGNNWEEV